MTHRTPASRGRQSARIPGTPPRPLQSEIRSVRVPSTAPKSRRSKAQRLLRTAFHSWVIELKYRPRPIGRPTTVWSYMFSKVPIVAAGHPRLQQCVVLQLWDHGTDKALIVARLLADSKNRPKSGGEKQHEVPSGQCRRLNRYLSR